MPQSGTSWITSACAFERFRLDAVNSSHFVWFLDESRFFQSSDGWILAVRRSAGVTVLALEPLIPGAPLRYELQHLVELRRALSELADELGDDRFLFAGIGEAFAQLLKRAGFQLLKIGEEPWVDPAQAVPKGNTGKGVRAARNQAIRQGCWVREWTAPEIAASPAKRGVIAKLYADWKAGRIFQLGGFLHSTDPFAHSEIRRYFVGGRGEEVEAVLTASPIPGRKAFFLEDHVYSASAPRGLGELLTTTALERLAPESEEVSLGVVSSLDFLETSDLPGAGRRILRSVSWLAGFFYDASGLQLFRKRFKPKAWTGIYLALGSKAAEPRARDWLQAALATALLFRPRLNPSVPAIFRRLSAPARRYPVTAAWGAAAILLFAAINRFGLIPSMALVDYGFSGNESLGSNLYRTFVSDLLFHSPGHFGLIGISTGVALLLNEKRLRSRTLALTLLGLSFFDDFVNHLVFIAPVIARHPAMGRLWGAHHDIGSSLILMALVGIRVGWLGRFRELVFTAIAIAILVAASVTSTGPMEFRLSVNHLLFYLLGFAIAKLQREYRRSVSRRVARGASPRLSVEPQPANEAMT